jgi:hypothetical protein
MLKVSPNRRFLMHEDGKPFFYLADTAWELFHRCNRAEAELYLQDRAAKGFTVIQAVALAEVDGVRVPNMQGDVPLHNEDPTLPNEKYFEFVDFVLQKAAELGLFIGLLPTWGDKWNKGTWGAGPEFFTPENARVYGEYLGKRYREQPNIIWILGGDRRVENETHYAITRAMADGITAGDGGNHLKSFHPYGGGNSAEYFHDDEWLDFNMWQSGHGRNSANYDMIAKDYARTPVKPVLDAEPGYEDHSAGFNIDNGYLDDYDNRKALYWAVFAGACGHTYGCHPIWQMYLPGRSPFTWARRPWTEALHLPGSGQMQHAKNLLQSRPYFSRVPDQELVISEIGSGSNHVQSTRDESGSYALIYVPVNTKVTINLDKLSGDTLNVFWFDVRTGVARRVGTVQKSGTHEFTTPSGGPDWVLVLDDASQNFPAPGLKVL